MPIMDCPHADTSTPIPPRTPRGCEECPKAGRTWVHLRLCLSSGHLGCCDSLPGCHATAHHRHTGHPIAASFGRGERWAWCYVDEQVLSVPATAEP
jgi:uncharacterized UBP type Zn finger protein